MSEDFVPDVAVARKPMCAAAPRGDGRIELALFHRAKALSTQPLFFFQETAHTTIPTVTRSHLDFLALAAPESKTTNTAQKATETKWSTARTGTKDFKG